MTKLPTPDALYESARDYAGTALAAHHAGKHHRVAVEAATALEHLVKACLARRSPAFLVELRPGEDNWATLVRLLGFPEGDEPKHLRTVGLQDALSRVRRFVTSKASRVDLDALIGLRNGSIHAAMSDEVEERLLVAFAQYADALLKDLGHERSEFWGGQLGVVDALLDDATDKVFHRVDVKLAQARANFAERYGGQPPELVTLIRRLSTPETCGRDEAAQDCPACESAGVVTGSRYIDWDVDWDDESGQPVNVSGAVWFTAEAFRCPVCGLRLQSESEMDAAGIECFWEEGPASEEDIRHVDWDAYHEWQAGWHAEVERMVAKRLEPGQAGDD